MKTSCPLRHPCPAPKRVKELARPFRSIDAIQLAVRADPRRPGVFRPWRARLELLHPETLEAAAERIDPPCFRTPGMKETLL